MDTSMDDLNQHPEVLEASRAPTTDMSPMQGRFAGPAIRSQLLTPEDHPSDSFSSQSKSLITSKFPASVPSPPESPELGSFNTERFRANDDVLYPDHNTQTQDRPLFEESRWRQDSVGTERSESMATPHDSPVSAEPTIASSAQPLEKNLAGTVASKGRTREPVGPVALWNTYGLDYYRYCLAQNEEHRRLIRERKLPPPVKSSAAASRDRYTTRIMSSIGNIGRVEKPQPKPRATKPALQPQAPARPESGRGTPAADSLSPIKRSRRQPSTSDTSLGGLPHGVQPKPRTRAAPSKTIEGQDEQWYDIPDHCPPKETLDRMTTSLHAQWPNNNKLDLDNDPDRHHLHPQELNVASVLRLPCNKYLANKRRVFNERLKSLKEGKEFNKTSAQNVTKIDVNKASKLWTAFDDIGWFDEKYFKQWL